MSTKFFKQATKELPYYGKITASRYKGVKGKAWKIISDYTRMRDFLRHKVCISCDKFLNDWRNIDAGHYISMGGHGAASGFNTDNVHGQCKYCNMQASQHTGVIFEQNIVLRGYDIDAINAEAQKTVKADDWYFLHKIKKVYEMFQELKSEFPDEEYPRYL